MVNLFNNKCYITLTGYLRCVSQNITLKTPGIKHQRHNKCCSNQVSLKNWEKMSVIANFNLI